MAILKFCRQPIQIFQIADLHQIGYYSFINENGIVFNGYKQKNSIKTDYEQYLIKKYVEEYKEKTGKQYLICEDIFYKYNGYVFFEFVCKIKITKYQEIEKSIDELMDIYTYINKKAKEDFKSTNLPIYTFQSEILLNDFTFPIGYEVSYLDSEYHIKKMKIDYIEYLHKNGLEDSTIPADDKINFYKPKELTVYVNGKEINRSINGHKIRETISYDIKKGDYSIHIKNIIDQIKAIEEYKYDATGRIINFLYNGTEYTLDTKLSLKDEIKGDKVPYIWTISKLVEFFKR